MWLQLPSGRRKWRMAVRDIRIPTVAGLVGGPVEEWDTEHAVHNHPAGEILCHEVLSHAWIKIPVFMEASEGIRILTMLPLTILADAKGQEGRIDTLSAMRYNTDADTMSECSEGE